MLCTEAWFEATDSCTLLTTQSFLKELLTRLAPEWAEYANTLGLVPAYYGQGWI